MITRLKLKMVFVAMSVMIAVFAVMLITLNTFMQGSSEAQTAQWLTFIAEQDGIVMPGGEGWRPMPPGRMGKPDEILMPAFEKEMIRGNRFFFVKVDAENRPIEIFVDMLYRFDETEAEDYAEKALASAKGKGQIDDMQFIVADKAYGKIAVFAERSAESRLLTQLIDISLVVMLCTFAGLIPITFLLVNFAVKPVKQTFEKQKQFVSDASHELKTPLTIISANTDVLGNEIGQNRWLYSIKTQTARMQDLIQDLLLLAKMDEAEHSLVLSEVNASTVVLGTALEFEVRAFEEKKRYLLDIDEGVLVRADKARLKQLVSILIDNALKHSAPEGEIRIALNQMDHAKAKLVVFNSGEGVQEQDKQLIFERFYRKDGSRARETGGYGLGLSIAQSIVSAHKWKIQVESVYGQWISFAVIIAV